MTRFGAVLRSELLKLRTVRSTAWTLVAAVAFNVGFAALAAVFLPDRLSAADKATLDTARVSLAGIHLSQVAFAVLGVLVMTSEYATGMIRTTLTAVPDRRLLLAAKAIVLAATALVAGTVASLAAFLVFQALLADDSLRSSLGDPGVLRAVTGGGLYLAVLGLLGLGLGTIIRATAGAVAAVLGLLFVPPILAQVLPQSWQRSVTPYVPLEAGSQVFSLRHDGGSLGAWSGFGVFCLYALLALGAGVVLMDRRDA